MRDVSRSDEAESTSRAIELVAAPSSLGLRPLQGDREPGAWRAPAALVAAGLATKVECARVVELPRPLYELEPQLATRIRNGVTIRRHALALADAVESALSRSQFALVLGGDCSILLGCLLGVRRLGRCGLVHVDAHSDFFHPGNYDAGSRLGSVAGMDLALATGHGELLLTHWPRVGVPLVKPQDVIQVGDRDAETSPGTIPLNSAIVQITIQEIRRAGLADVSDRVVGFLEQRGFDRVWLHVDVDVLDQRVMPAVDSPGSPGLDFDELSALVARLAGTQRVVGLDLTIYDPEGDADGRLAGDIVDCLTSGLAALARPAASSGREARA